MALTQEQKLKAIVDKDYDTLTQDMGLIESAAFKAAAATNTESGLLISGLQKGIQEEFKEKFPEMSQNQLEASAKSVTAMMNDNPQDIAQFIIDTKDNEAFNAIMEQAKTPEEALKITKAATVAYQESPAAFNQFIASNTAGAGAIEATIAQTEVPNIPPPTQNPTPQQPEQTQIVMGQTVTAPQADSTQPTNPEEAQRAAFEKLLNEHIESFPEGPERDAEAALAGHFVAAIATDPPADPKLKEAIDKFIENNGELLNAGEGDSMTAGFLDKKTMIHDLLDSYKKTPDKAYEALANPNFQTEAFMQYSSIGQAVSMIAQPILNWIGGLFGQDGDLGSWAQMDFGAMMQDFQAFFNGGLNNAMAMSNNDLGLMDSIGVVFNVTKGAVEDTLETTPQDRQYMAHHNPDAPQPSVTLVDGETNQIIDPNRVLGMPTGSNADATRDPNAQANQLNQNNPQNDTPNLGAPPV